MESNIEVEPFEKYVHTIKLLGIMENLPNKENILNK